MAPDLSGNIWTFMCWGRPYRLVSPLLDHTSSDTTPAQIECGWGFNSVLTESGDVYIWWPFDRAAMRQSSLWGAYVNSDENIRHNPHADGISCSLQDLYLNPERLPVLPQLPDLGHMISEDEETRIVKIAGMDCFLIALTNKGHVLKFDDLSNEISLESGRWEYVRSYYCDYISTL